MKTVLWLLFNSRLHVFSARFFAIAIVRELCVCVCVYVCVCVLCCVVFSPPRLLIASGMMWYDLN